MRTRLAVTLITAVVSACFLPGCSEESPTTQPSASDGSDSSTGSTGDTASPPPPAPATDARGRSIGPHGGALVTLAENEASIEAVLDPDSGTLSLYALGPKIHEPYAFENAFLEFRFRPLSGPPPATQTAAQVTILRPLPMSHNKSIFDPTCLVCTSDSLRQSGPIRLEIMNRVRITGHSYDVDAFEVFPKAQAPGR